MTIGRCFRLDHNNHVPNYNSDHDYVPNYNSDHDYDDHDKRPFFQKNVVDYIRIRGNLADTYSDDEIHRAIGILR